MPAYTYTASASVVCHVGAKLVLIDSQTDSLEILAICCGGDGVWFSNGCEYDCFWS